MDNVTSAPVVMVKREVELPKEINEIGQSLVNLVRSLKVANKDGFQAATDVPVVVLENLKSLGLAIDNAIFAKVEITEKLPQSVNALTLAGTDILEVLTSEE